MNEQKMLLYILFPKDKGTLPAFGLYLFRGVCAEEEFALENKHQFTHMNILQHECPNSTYTKNWIHFL